MRNDREIEADQDGGITAGGHAVRGKGKPAARKPISDPMLLGFAPLHQAATGVALGSVSGAAVFLLTLLEWHRGHPAASLGLVSQYFVGYTVTPWGALVGLLWSFAAGFVLGWGFAWLRNLLLRICLIAMRSRAEIEQYSDLLDRW